MDGCRRNPPVIPLHVHSHWSLLGGLASVPELVAAAVGQGLPALALTDANALYGAGEFVRACRAAGIKPLVGAELTLEGGHPLVLLARGPARLCQSLRADYAPARPAGPRGGAGCAGCRSSNSRATPRGCLRSSGGTAGPVRRAAALGRRGTARNAWPGTCVTCLAARTFLSSCNCSDDGDAGHAARLAALAARLGVATVATHDVRYLAPTDGLVYCVLDAMRAGTRLATHTRLPDLSLPSPAELRRRFAAFS
jgi:DNA polymerase III alpha subunit